MSKILQYWHGKIVMYGSYKYRLRKKTERSLKRVKKRYGHLSIEDQEKELKGLIDKVNAKKSIIQEIVINTLIVVISVSLGTVCTRLLQELSNKVDVLDYPCLILLVAFSPVIFAFIFLYVRLKMNSKNLEYRLWLEYYLNQEKKQMEEEKNDL